MRNAERLPAGSFCKSVKKELTMIAVIGCAKETVNVKMSMPMDEGERALMGIEEPKTEADIKDDEIAVKDSGCGVNIAKQLAALGYETEFISVVGDDTLGAAVKAGLDDAGVKRGGVDAMPGSTAVDVHFLNVLGEIVMFNKNLEAVKKITPDFVRSKADILDRADYIVVDGSIPQETIEYIAGEYGPRDNVKIFFDPASVSGGYKAADVLEHFHCVLPGRMEAEAMTGKTVLSEEQIREAGLFFEEAGVDRCVITIKGGGMYYREGESEGILRPEKLFPFGSTSGAGDVVSAAVIAGTIEGKDMETVAKEAMAKAAAFLSELGLKAVED